MTVTEGISVGVPIVSAVGSLGFGALVGGVGGAFATHQFALKREREQQQRERDGLLHLINVEMRLIRATAKEFLEDPHIMESAQSLATATTAWEASQVRLAQLLPREEFPKLVVYYQMAAVLSNFLELLSVAWARKDQARVAQAVSAAKTQIELLGRRDEEAHEILARYIDTSVGE